MDSVAEIKARLPIEQLVAQYCQLQKKGRSYRAVCPFHQDKNPSLLVSPDKGIAYCFACQSGGDIFSFYQKIEGVDFRQALKDLAERAGVKIEHVSVPGPARDERERARACLETAAAFYREQLAASAPAQEYLRTRGVTDEQVALFELGVAPDGFTATYDALLRQGFSRNEVAAAGLGIQKDLKEGRVYDRFRNRLMFPIQDVQGRIIGFGGRTLGNDDAKYINTSDGPLYHKSTVLYGLHRAREAMRETKRCIVVEGYFDVLACHRVGVSNVVATCGTALTEDHVRLLQRSVDTVVLCLDSDRAGREAAERAFQLLARAGVNVQLVELPQKDPGDLAVSAPELLAQLLRDGGLPYVEVALRELKGSDLKSAEGLRRAQERLFILLSAIPTRIERMHYMESARSLFGVDAVQLSRDLDQFERRRPDITTPTKAPELAKADDLFDPAELALGLLLAYPQHRSLLSELIEPEEGFAAVLFAALRAIPHATPEALTLPDEHRERLGVLLLYCEHHGFTEWSESLAAREIRRNCQFANRQMLRGKQAAIRERLLQARAEGRSADELLLQNQYQQVLKLTRMAA
jgi:DNA primase